MHVLVPCAHAFFTIYGLNFGNSVGTTYLPPHLSEGKIPLLKFTSLFYEKPSMHTGEKTENPHQLSAGHALPSY